MLKCPYVAKLAIRYRCVLRQGVVCVVRIGRLPALYVLRVTRVLTVLPRARKVLQSMLAFYKVNVAAHNNGGDDISLTGDVGRNKLSRATALP